MKFDAFESMSAYYKLIGSLRCANQFFGAGDFINPRMISDSG